MAHAASTCATWPGMVCPGNVRSAKFETPSPSTALSTMLSIVETFSSRNGETSLPLVFKPCLKSYRSPAATMALKCGKRAEGPRLSHSWYSGRTGRTMPSHLLHLRALHASAETHSNPFSLAVLWRAAGRWTEWLKPVVGRRPPPCPSSCGWPPPSLGIRRRSPTEWSGRAHARPSAAFPSPNGRRIAPRLGIVPIRVVWSPRARRWWGRRASPSNRARASLRSYLLLNLPSPIRRGLSPVRGETHITDSDLFIRPG